MSSKCEYAHCPFLLFLLILNITNFLFFFSIDQSIERRGAARRSDDERRFCLKIFISQFLFAHMRFCEGSCKSVGRPASRSAGSGALQSYLACFNRTRSFSNLVVICLYQYISSRISFYLSSKSWQLIDVCFSGSVRSFV